MRKRATNEHGSSLVEVIVTVAIMGIAFVVFLGGMGTSFLASSQHRKQAVAQANIRNFAEAVKAAPFNTACENPEALKAKYLAAYNAPPPASAGAAVATTSHVAPSVVSPAAKSRLLAFYALAGGVELTMPSGMEVGWTSASKAADPPAKVSVGFADQALTAEGPTGTRVATSATADSVAQLVAVPSTLSSGVARRGIVADSTPESGAALQLTLRSPASTAIGDAMFAQVAVRTTSAIITPPSGWALLSTATQGSTVKSLVYQKIARTPGVGSFDWTFDVATEAAGGIVSYGGATSGYDATVQSVTFVLSDGSREDCPAAVEARDFQVVSLQLVSLDNQATQTIDVFKRCRIKPSTFEPCEDSP